MTGAHEDPAAPPGADQAEEGAAAAAATTGRSVLTGGLWYLASYVVPQAYTIVVSLVAARFLGPSGMGLQSYISFISVSLTTVLSSSVYLALMRYIGESVGQGRRDLLPGLLGWAWRIEAVAAAVGAGVLLAVALLGADPQGAWAFSAVVCAAAVLHTVPTAVLIGLQQFRRASAVGLTTGLVGTLAIVGVLWAGRRDHRHVRGRGRGRRRQPDLDRRARPREPPRLERPGPTPRRGACGAASGGTRSSPRSACCSS